MYPDILRLRDWYVGPLGHAARRTIQAYFDRAWPDIRGKTVLSIGFGLPYLDLWRREARVLAAMPAHMGVIHWPLKGENQTCMVWENALPFTDNSIDRLLITHCLEFSSDVGGLLEECKRVLRPDGRMLLIVPNRMSPWCRIEVSPLSRGQPFSHGQLLRLLENHDFHILHSRYGLFPPPSSHPWLLKIWNGIEKGGEYLHAPLGGIVLAEAELQVMGAQVVRVEPNLKRSTRPAMDAVPT